MGGRLLRNKYDLLTLANSSSDVRVIVGGMAFEWADLLDPVCLSCEIIKEIPSCAYVDGSVWLGTPREICHGHLSAQKHA
jgi:hypothetical protein